MLIQDDRPRRLLWLDGWRAIAVGIVIFSHIIMLHFNSSVPIPGTLGVYIFFAISGYIVTSLLVREQHSSGSIDLKAFYVRRAARLLPPLLMYAAVCLSLFPTDPIVRRGSARALLFTCNIKIDEVGCGWLLGHTWSLAFEEQYYLILPILLLFKLRWMFLVVVPVALAPFILPENFIGRIGFIQIYLLLALGALYAVHEQKLALRLAKVSPFIAFTGLLALGATLVVPPSLPQKVLTLLLTPAVVLAVFVLPAASPAFKRF